MTLTRDEALSVAVATLLRGPVYAEENQSAWATLRAQPVRVSEYLKVLGMRVVVDDVDEYAYLRTFDELPEGMPRLHRRHKLGMRASVLLVLLRQRMTSADAEEATPRLIVTRDEMVEWMRLYHPAGTSEERIAADIPKLDELGYLKRLRGSDGTYEARRIIKAQVSADYSPGTPRSCSPRLPPERAPTGTAETTPASSTRTARRVAGTLWRGTAE